MQKERVLHQITQVRDWGISHGLPMENMYVEETDIEFFWWVHWSSLQNPDDIGSYYFGADKAEAEEWQRKVREIEGEEWETALIGSPFMGSEDAPIVPALIRTSEYSRVHYMFHEAIHVWVQRFFSNGEEVDDALNEGLAEYLGLALMVCWFRQFCSQKVMLASEYVGYRTAFIFATEKLALTARKGDSQETKNALNDFFFLGDLWGSNYAIPGDGSGEPLDTMNAAQIEGYRTYSRLFCLVLEYFQKDKIDLFAFLANPFPYREALLKLGEEK